MIESTLHQAGPIVLKVESAAPEETPETVMPQCRGDHGERQNAAPQKPESSDTLTKGSLEEFEPELSVAQHNDSPCQRL